jgi:hypothetical protein
MFESISNFFNKPKTPEPSALSNLYIPPKVNPSKIPSAIRQLESSGGTDPNTPRNQQRVMMIPAANQNEKPRTVKYNIGYGGEYGLTPDALAELAKSKINVNAHPSTYTKYGKPLIPGKSTIEIQKLLMTPEGAGQLANEYFMSKRTNKDDYSPEALTNDYMDNYVGKNNKKSYTPQNRKRVLEYFKSIIEK